MKKRIYMNITSAAIPVLVFSRLSAVFSFPPALLCISEILTALLFVILSVKYRCGEKLYEWITARHSLLLNTLVLAFSLIACVPLKAVQDYITGGSCSYPEAASFGIALALFLLCSLKSVKTFLSEIRFKEYGIPLAVWCACLLCCVALTYFSKTIYTYDYSIYHERAAIYTDLLLTDPVALCGRIYTSFGTDYSGLPSLIAVPFMLVLGCSRWVYVLSLCFYLLPALCVIYKFCIALTKKGSYVFILTVLQFPLLIFLERKGFPDIFGMCLLMCCVYLCTVKKNCTASHYFIAGVFAALAFLFRRYNLMPLFAFFAVLLVSQAISYIRSKDKKVISNYLSAVCGCAATLFLPFQKMIVEIVFMRNYGDSYSYYQQGLSTSMLYICKAFSTLLLIAAFISIVLFFKQRIIRFSACALAMTAFLFLSTQTPGKHHMVIFMMWLIIIMLPLTGLMLEKSKTAAALIIVFSILQTSVCFIPIEKHAVFHNIMLETENKPEQLLDTYCSISDFLSENTDEENQAYIIGSSDTLSVQTISNCYFSVYGVMKNPYLLPSAIVDSRDTFPNDFFEAKYILVTDPVQYERGEEYQQIVKIPAQMLLNNEGWAAAFSPVDSYKLDEDTTAILYERTRSVSDEEKQSLLNTLSAAGCITE